MKKRNGWKWTLALAIWFAASAVYALTSNMYDVFVRWPYAAALAVVFAVLTLVLRSGAKKSQKPVQSVGAEQKEEKPTPQPVVKFSTSVVTHNDGFAVAGVTYKNDDGSSRQEILREICSGGNRGSTPVRLEQFEYEGSPALRVCTPHGCVGNIRANDVPEVLELLEDNPEDIYMDVETFVNDRGQTIYRADVYLD